MKKNLFINIIDETVMEVNTSFAETVERLMSQQGSCHNADSQGINLIFYCNKKGKIHILNGSGRNNYSDRIYKVEARVYEDDGKTKVKIQTLHDKTTVAYRIISYVFLLILICGYIIFSICTKNVPNIKYLITLLLFPLLIVYGFILSHKEKRNKDNDIKIMKQEIINRVEAVKRWND